MITKKQKEVWEIRKFIGLYFSLFWVTNFGLNHLFVYIHALYKNWKRRTSISKAFSFHVYLTLLYVQLEEGNDLLMQEYPKGVNQNFTYFTC